MREQATSSKCLCAQSFAPTHTHTRQDDPQNHILKDVMFIMLTIPRLNTIAKLCQKEYTN